jgi:competence protein CoiA
MLSFKCPKPLLFALTKEGKTVFIQNAKSIHSYDCPHCFKEVKPKKNFFFHLGKPKKHPSKTLLHQEMQNLFLRELKTSLEVPFPSIHRIGDIVWEEEKLIFEIQCSPITLLEIEKRTKDYLSLGYQVVWILYEKTFLNHYEEIRRFLLPTPHYFFNEKKEIFDQKGEMIQLKKKKIPEGNFPKELELRKRYWGFYFSGDALDRFLSQKKLSFFEKWL